MAVFFSRYTSMCAVLATIFVLVVQGCSSSESDAQLLRVERAYVVKPVSGRPVTAGYFSLVNETQNPAVLIDIRSSTGISIELHETKSMGDMMAMSKLDHVTVAKGETLNFAPGGMHLMIRGVPLDQSEVVLEFCFESQPCQPVMFEVR